jgi:hypothetical protein
MNRTIHITKAFFLFLCLSVATFSTAQSASNKDEAAVQQLIIDCFEGVWSDLDSTKISLYHTADYLLLEHGEEWTNQTIKNYMAKALKAKQIPKRENRFEFIKFEKNKKLAWLAYHNYATWSIDGKEVGKAHWLESAVAVKTRKGWKLKMLHSTRVESK